MPVGDRRLQAVGAQAAADLLRAGQDGPTPAYRGAVPAAAVLLLQPHRLAVRPGAGGEARRRQLEQGQKAVDLGLVRHQPGQDPREALCLAREDESDQIATGARRGSFGEDQVDHVEHRAEALGPLHSCRHRKRHAGSCEGLLRGRDPGLHGGGRDEQRRGDLVARQTTDHPQGERPPRLARQHGVAGDEHQREHVVVDLVRIPQHVLRVPGRMRCRRRDRPRPGSGRERRTSRRGRSAGGTRRSRVADRP
jgi:hypothetical protein